MCVRACVRVVRWWYTHLVGVPGTEARDEGHPALELPVYLHVEVGKLRCGVTNNKGRTSEHEGGGEEEEEEGEEKLVVGAQKPSAGRW